MAQTQINGGTQIRSGSITGDRIATGALTKTTVGLDNVDNTSDANKPVSTATTTALGAKENTSAKGVAGGYASLDGGGKVPVSQLPNSIMEYQGTFNASTNTPTLVNGTGSPGDVYRVSVAGTVLSLDLAVGDYVIYNGSTWEKSDTTDAVASVSGRTGNVTLTKADVGLSNVNDTSDQSKPVSTATQTALNSKEGTITAGTTAQYFRGDKTFQTLNAAAISDFNTAADARVATGIAAKFVTRETPTGAANGTNTSFVLANTPVVGSESVFLNGILQEPGSGNDYTISVATITYLTAPVTGDKVRVSYIK